MATTPKYQKWWNIITLTGAVLLAAWWIFRRRTNRALTVLTKQELTRLDAKQKAEQTELERLTRDHLAKESDVAEARARLDKINKDILRAEQDFRAIPADQRGDAFNSWWDARTAQTPGQANQ